VVDLERKSSCADHEARIRILEKYYEQLILRIDRTETAVHAIERAVSALQDEMKNHISIMEQHIDLAFSRHEMNEMKMHKDMLVQAMRAVLGLVVFLATGIGTLAWWIFTHVVA
jgi:hypothetical protein